MSQKPEIARKPNSGSIDSQINNIQPPISDPPCSDDESQNPKACPTPEGLTAPKIPPKSGKFEALVIPIPQSGKNSELDPTNEIAVADESVVSEPGEKDVTRTRVTLPVDNHAGSVPSQRDGDAPIVLASTGGNEPPAFLSVGVNAESDMLAKGGNVESTLLPEDHKAELIPAQESGNIQLDSLPEGDNQLPGLAQEDGKAQLVLTEDRNGQSNLSPKIGQEAVPAEVDINNVASDGSSVTIPEGVEVSPVPSPKLGSRVRTFFTNLFSFLRTKKKRQETAKMR